MFAQGVGYDKKSLHATAKIRQANGFRGTGRGKGKIGTNAEELEGMIEMAMVTQAK